jgi:hypothetical protein
MVFVIVNSLCGFALSYIHGIDHIFLFGNSIAEGSNNGQPFANSNNIFVEKGIYNIPF